MSYAEYSTQMEYLESRLEYLREVEIALKSAANPCPMEEDNDVYDAIEAAQSENWRHMRSVERKIADLDRLYEQETA